MSLRTLFDESTVTDMMTDWPTKPAVYDLPAESNLPDIANAQILNTYLTTGTAPADEIIVIKDGSALHPRAYTTAGHLDPAKVARWRGRRYTVQLRNLNRWCPPLHAMCAAIQAETGYGCHVTAFITPAAGQGLSHHWDQNMGVICQIAGRKTWQIWESAADEPHQSYLLSNNPSSSDLVNQLKGVSPDREFDLEPGRVLVLPRGYMHIAHARNQREESTHLTFVLRERTGFWIGERLMKAAITLAALRRVIPPARIGDRDAFAEQIDEARNLLMGYLARVDEAALATEILNAARTEQGVDYV